VRCHKVVHHLCFKYYCDDPALLCNKVFVEVGIVDAQISVHAHQRIHDMPTPVAVANWEPMSFQQINRVFHNWKLFAHPEGWHTDMKRAHQDITAAAVHSLNIPNVGIEA